MSGIFSLCCTLPLGKMASAIPPPTHPQNAAPEWLMTLMGSPAMGSLSALISSTALQPLDVIRTKQQVSLSTEPAYGGFWKTVRRIHVEEGFVGFFRGLGPTIWRVIPGSALYFTLLNYMTPQKKATGETSLPKSLTLKEFGEYFFGAAASRSVASTVFLPLTVVKTRFEAMGSVRPYTSTWNAIMFIQKIEGWRSLWSGLWPTLLRDVPHSALYFSIYNHLKRVLHPLRKSDSKIPIGFYNLAAGVSAGLIATLTNHPFDVIRTRTQTQFGNQKPLGMVKITAQILKMEGWRAFTKGLTPRLIRRSLYPAFTWTFYEELILLFKR